MVPTANRSVNLAIAFRRYPFNLTFYVWCGRIGLINYRRLAPWFSGTHLACMPKETTMISVRSLHPLVLRNEKPADSKVSPTQGIFRDYLISVVDGHRRARRMHRAYGKCCQAERYHQVAAWALIDVMDCPLQPSHLICEL